MALESDSETPPRWIIVPGVLSMIFLAVFGYAGYLCHQSQWAAYEKHRAEWQAERIRREDMAKEGDFLPLLVHPPAPLNPTRKFF